MKETSSSLYTHSRKQKYLIPSLLFCLLMMVVMAGHGGNLLPNVSNRVIAASPQSSQGASLWQDVDEKSIGNTAQRQIIPDRYRTVRLNRESLQQFLKTIPLEFTDEARKAPAELSLPMPYGGYQRFAVVESPIMESGLAAKFPEIKTYRGQGIDDPGATLRFDVTSAGFHALVLSNEDSVYIDPYAKGDLDNYISYYKRDYKSAEEFSCLVSDDKAKSGGSSGAISQNLSISNGQTLKTFRLAVAATGEYTQSAGGTVNLALSAITTVISRVDGIYERELAVRLILIANDNLIIYTDPATDPYTTNLNTILQENQTNLDNVIGPANYDVGQVFGNLGAGIGWIGSVCIEDDPFFHFRTKGRGLSSGGPTGDSFAVAMVSHELGHQFGASHSFNATSSSCGNFLGGSQRAANSAYEPGSGSTIMSYGGLCFPQNYVTTKSDYFLVSSLDQMLGFISTLSCPVPTNTNNQPPSVNPGASYTIPQATPFTLTASGFDPNGDPLTYTWEEFDLGAASPPDTDLDLQARPIYRSYQPTSSPSRTFPALRYIQDNANVPGFDPVTNLIPGESLSLFRRTLNFQVTARDNRSNGGGVGSSATQVNVTTSSGPFLVTAPTSAVMWASGSQQTVTWNVANTNLSPVFCQNVNIWLSTDGGATFPTPLASSTPNDGSQVITLPNITATAARVRVEAVGNIFFDISDTNFLISPASCTYTLSSLSRSVGSNQVNKSLTITTSGTCSWQAKSNVPWITVPSTVFTGTNSFSYTVLANVGGSTRVGTISVAGQTHTVTQSDSGTCTFSLDRSSATYGAVGSTGRIFITTSTCSWSASSNDSWIVVLSGNVGLGSGFMVYGVTPNTSTASRTGTLTVAGLNFTVTQLGSQAAVVYITGDNGYSAYFNGTSIGSGSDWTQAQTYAPTLQTGKNVLAIQGTDAGGIAAVLAEIQVAGQRIGSSATWKVSTNAPGGWQAVNFDDSGWANATEYGGTGTYPWLAGVNGIPVDTPAKWIWSSNNDADDVVYIRVSFNNGTPPPPTATAIITSDNSYTAYFNGTFLGQGADWVTAQTYSLTLLTGKNVLAIQGVDAGGIAAVLAEIQTATLRLGSNATWKVSLTGPTGWQTVNFDDSGWANATEYGSYGVGPWGTAVSGMPLDTPARWIWSSNNDADNLVYIRVSFNNGAPPTGTAKITCDNSYTAYFNGTLLGQGNDWVTAQTYSLTLLTGKNVLAIQGVDAGGIAGVLAEIQTATQRLGSNATWKVSLIGPTGWQAVNFDDTGWAGATDYGAYGVGPWGTAVSGMPLDTPARWIWSSNSDADNLVYIRVSFNN